jgi:hypothetical protein
MSHIGQSRCLCTSLHCPTLYISRSGMSGRLFQRRTRQPQSKLSLLGTDTHIRYAAVLLDVQVLATDTYHQSLRLRIWLTRHLHTIPRSQRVFEISSLLLKTRKCAKRVAEVYILLYFFALSSAGLLMRISFEEMYATLLHMFYCFLFQEHFPRRMCCLSGVFERAPCGRRPSSLVVRVLALVLAANPQHVSASKEL